MELFCEKDDNNGKHQEYIRKRNQLTKLPLKQEKILFICPK